MEQTAAIIGFGCAGFSAVKALRSNGWKGNIDVYDKSNSAPSNPMLTTYYVGDKISLEGTHPFGELDKIVDKYNITFIGKKVLHLDSQNKTIEIEDGSKKTYNNIIISSGAKAFIPPIKGAESSKVLSIRDIADAEYMKNILKERDVKSAIVVGASMTGVKVVELLIERGIDVSLVDMAAQVLSLATLPYMAEKIEKKLADRGVKQYYKAELKEMDTSGSEIVALFGDGSNISADLIIICVGTVSMLDFLDDKIKRNRGIRVFDTMETSVSGIYAAGDCAESYNIQTGESHIIGLWANATSQGRVAGENIAGLNTHFFGDIPHNITHFMGMDFIGMGDNRSEGEVLSFINDNESAEIVMTISNGSIRCINMIDEFSVSGSIINWFKRQLSGVSAPLSDIVRTRLYKQGFGDNLINALETYQPKPLSQKVGGC